jgi:hypothetical protein
LKKSILHFITVAAIFTAFACQDIIILPLNDQQARVVIEGLISNRVGSQSVRVSESLNYYDTIGTPPIKDAEVSLLTVEGQLIEAFSYSEIDSAYVPSPQFVAEIGMEYILQVIAKGEIYQAAGQIIRNANLDSIYYLSKEQLEVIGQNVFDGDYFLFVDGSLNSEMVEYFRLTVTVNDTLRNSRGDIANSILSSEFFGSEFQFLPVPGDFVAQDSIHLELYSLNEDIFQYYQEFTNLLFNDGGVFSPPPVNPTTNIINITAVKNYALGYVQFSAIIEKDLYIDEEK